MAVLTLALKDEQMRKVEEYAKKEERTKEELVDDAIDFYLHEKFMDEMNAHGRKYGITPEIIREEIRQMRAES
ncbi:MAG: hypothetical protein FWB85_05880 [Chitinispirillia bacterium]|nr:hypothetical protein [Chitinispirillia bacterium]